MSSLNPDRIVILDRDGVINEDSPDYIKTPDEWIPIPGSMEAIALLHQKGFKIYVATNQAGIARGKFSVSSLQAIHEKMQHEVETAGGRISGIQYCPHHPDEKCQCRKPEPGMLYRITEESGAELSGAPYVGDSLKDIRAAETAGCKPVLVLTGNGLETHQVRPNLAHVYKDLLAFAKDCM
jgi:D-glycero-D-manno-heptose 1,7-bisphosphate phosphatase